VKVLRRQSSTYDEAIAHPPRIRGCLNTQINIKHHALDWPDTRVPRQGVVGRLVTTSRRWRREIPKLKHRGVREWLAANNTDISEYLADLPRAKLLNNITVI
jgi:hypothetical protein